MLYRPTHLCLLLITGLLFTACAPQYSGKRVPKVINGEIDLTGWDFEKDGPVKLDGEWLFVWRQLLTKPTAVVKPKEGCEIKMNTGFANSPCQGSVINLPLLSQVITGDSVALVNTPHRWSKDDKYVKYGYGIYGLGIKGLPENSRKGIVLQSIRGPLGYSAFNLWFKNSDTLNLVKSIGEVGIDQKTERLKILPLTLTLKLDSEQEATWLFLETSNYSWRTGGLLEPPTILTYSQANENSNGHWALELLATGILLFAGIHQLLIFSLRKTDWAPFYLALICLLMAFRTLVTSLILDSLFPGIKGTFFLKLQYLSLTFLAFLISLFFYHLMQKQTSQLTLKVIITLAGLASLFVIVTDSSVYTNFLIFNQVVLLSAVVYVIYSLIRNIRSKFSILRKNAQISLSLLLFTVFAAVHDIAKVHFLLRTPDLSGFSTVFFLIGMGYILAKQNAGMRKKSEVLSATLKSELHDKIQIAQDLEDQAGRLQRLTQLTLAVQGASSFDGILDKLRVVFKKNYNVENYLIYIVNEEQTALVPYRFTLDKKLPTDLYANIIGTDLTIGSGKGINENVVLRKRAIYLRRIPDWTSSVPEENKNRSDMGISSFYALPLIMKGTVFAVITMIDINPEFQMNQGLNAIRDLTRAQRKQIEELLGLVSASLYLTIQDARLRQNREQLGNEENKRKLIETNLEELEQRQLEITQELTEASNQLIQAEKLSGLGAMVSGIAHDINNPLNFIETARFQEQEKLEQLKEHLLGLVPEGEEGDEFKEDLLARFDKLGKLNEQIKTGVTRVTEISKSMRNASRADTEKTNDVNLVEVIEESLIITGNKVKQFQLINNIPDGIALATCNRSQIGQVVMNFLSNAADALVEYKEQNKEHKGTIQVDLAISNHSDGQNQLKTVQISVSDNGAGVPQENRDKVLNAFFTTKAAGVGTGLGLAICGKIAQAHDGTIHIEDGLPNDQGGHGARFTLEFVG